MLSTVGYGVRTRACEEERALEYVTSLERFEQHKAVSGVTYKKQPLMHDCTQTHDMGLVKNIQSINKKYPLNQICLQLLM